MVGKREEGALSVVGNIFKRDLREATGLEWEEWLARLQAAIPQGTHDSVRTFIASEFGVSEEWSEMLALVYGQRLGRVPAGVTKDAGVQIGVRRTLTIAKERIWEYLTSREGRRLWLGDVPEFRLEKGFAFASADGVAGKLTVVEPYRKLRMNWKRDEWDEFSRLQLYVLDASEGKTTLSVHQEKLEDVYMREIMRRHWEEAIRTIGEEAGDRQDEKKPRRG